MLYLYLFWGGSLHKPGLSSPLSNSHHETHDPENILDARVRKGYSRVDMIAWIGFVSRGPLDSDWSMSRPRPRPWNFSISPYETRHLVEESNIEYTADKHKHYTLSLERYHYYLWKPPFATLKITQPRDTDGWDGFTKVNSDVTRLTDLLFLGSDHFL